MKYNLAELFGTKTNKQIANLIKSRLLKSREAWDFIQKNDHFPLNEVPRIVTKLKKADLVESDCIEWLNEAINYVSEDFWNSIIEELNWCYDGNCYEDMIDA
tara:strand:+ start:111 stop:416 length:306 start_codon:yes stop_codon:yes gene_type:complete